MISDKSRTPNFDSIAVIEVDEVALFLSLIIIAQRHKFWNEETLIDASPQLA
jgi:hypothetical protein